MHNDKTGSALRYKLEGLVFHSRWDHGIFHWLNISGRTMVLGSTQPLRQVSTSKGGRCVALTTLLPSCADYIEILKASAYWSPKDLSRSVQGLIYSSVFFLREHPRSGRKGTEMCIRSIHKNSLTALWCGSLHRMSINNDYGERQFTVMVKGLG